jgi:hypothetical protein
MQIGAELPEFGPAMRRPGKSILYLARELPLGDQSNAPVVTKSLQP